MRCFLFFILISAPAFAGQSWVTGNSSGAQVASNSSVPSVNIPFCKAVAWDSIPQTFVNGSGYFNAGNPFIGNALPMFFNVNNAGGGVELAVDFIGETGVSGGGTALGSLLLSGTAGGAVWGWVCHDMAAYGGTNTDYAAFYDKNGALIASAQQTYTSIAPIGSTGWQVSGGYGADAFHIAFERICTGEAAIPLWKTVPTTYGGCPLGTTLLEWKFDGTLDDSSGNGYTATVSGAGGTTPTYAATNFQGVTPILKTLNNPSWAYTVPMRAGNPNQLDCSSSYSQSDAANTVHCFWQVLSGPSSPAFDSHTAYQPTLTGLVFGDYVVQLTGTDITGDNATASADIPAVATDSNGVVVQASPAADTIYGPMIALGKNPWGLQDYEAQQMVNQQFTYQNCCTPPTWTTSGQGTVSYTFCGVGGSCGVAGTRIDSAISSATSLSVDVDNVSVLNLSTLPTVPTTIFVDSEVMLICGTTGTAGRQTLSVCYNGRGLQGGGQYASAATTHGLGANAGQFKITGSSTLFTSDPKTAICPSAQTLSLGPALPSPLGRVLYSAGAATMTPGSAAIVGVGTSWTNANGIYGSNGLLILVKGTHGGAAFSFIATITSLTDATHIGLSAPYPSDADAGSFSYAIVSYRAASINYTRVDGSTGRALQTALQACIGDLQMGGLAAHDIQSVDTTAMSGQNYSYKDAGGIASPFGPNFYGTGLAVRAYYLRSGYQKALQLANFIDDYWVRDPELDGGYTGSIPLLSGAGVIGAFADLVTNPNSLVSADCTPGNPACNMRGFVYQAAQLTTIGCDGDDTRDTGYERAWIALAAKYDVGTYQNTWLSNLEAVYNNHDVGGNGCKQADNSFANGFLVDNNGATPNVPNSGYAPLNLTYGSAIATDATGLGITADRCSIAASGTIAVTNGSGVATDTGNNLINPNAGNFGRRLFIHGTKNNGATPYIGVFSYLYTSSSAITLNGQWPGDTGNFTYVIEDTGYPTTLGSSLADHANMQTAWACTWNSATQITLDRSWTGTSGVYNLYQTPGRPNSGYAIGGYGQQPYMLGIAVTGISYAAAADTGSYPALWTTLAQNAASWLWNNAYDPYTQGIQYGAIYGGCDQKVPVSTTVGFILGTYEGSGDFCQNDLTPNGGIDVARGVAVEALGSLTQYYESNPGPALKAFGDTVYGSIFASRTLTAPGVYTALDNIPGSNQNFCCYKWPGFYFGMGMSHQWPAARLGGVLAAVNRTLEIGVCLGAGCPGNVPNATSVDVVMTAPNGIASTTNCTTSPCAVTADARQGNYLMVLKYKSTGAVLAQSAPQILIVQ